MLGGKKEKRTVMFESKGYNLDDYLFIFISEQ